MAQPCSCFVVGASCTDITALYRNIERAELDIAGSNVRDRRSTMLLSVLSDSESRQRDDMWRHLLSLNRTLKVSCYVRHSVVCPTWQIMSYHTRHCHIMQHYCNAQNGRLQALPTDIKRAATLLTFKKKLKTFLLSKHLC